MNMTEAVLYSGWLVDKEPTAEPPEGFFSRPVSAILNDMAAAAGDDPLRRAQFLEQTRHDYNLFRMALNTVGIFSEAAIAGAYDFDPGALKSIESEWIAPEPSPRWSYADLEQVAALMEHRNALARFLDHKAPALTM